MSQPAVHGPLTGLRVLEIGHFVAAPFCTRLLADLGADVIKIEPPTGDPVRQWGKQLNGGAPWWSLPRPQQALHHAQPEASRRRSRSSCAWWQSCDALVENFRPGQLAKLGLGHEALRRARPDLVIAHISGFGQDGPYRDRAAFGVIGEAIGGLRYLCNHPPGIDRPAAGAGRHQHRRFARRPLRRVRHRRGALAARPARTATGKGRTLDVALTESVLSMMEGMLPEYGVFGSIRQPTGVAHPDRRAVQRLPDLRRQVDSDRRQFRAAVRQARGADGHSRTSPAIRASSTTRRRVQNVDGTRPHHRDLDRRRLTAEETDRRLTEADIPCTLIYTAAEMRGGPAVPPPRHGPGRGGSALRPRRPPSGRRARTCRTIRAPSAGPGPPIGAHTTRSWESCSG